MLLCLHLDRPDDTIVTALAECVPRLAAEAGARIWVDARGLDVVQLHARLGEVMKSRSVNWRAGASLVPIVAQLAAASSGPGELICIRPGEERDYQADFPLISLEIEDRLVALLEGVGVSTCSELGALPREAVEVRFGAEALHAWRLARGEDSRRLFRPVPPEEPHASIDFIDYVVTDPERLLFTGNSLINVICDELVMRGSHARFIVLTLPLADGTKWQRELRPARATADRVVWLRLLRSLLERLTVSDAVAGMHLEVRASQAAAVMQGDLFDSGFATAGAVEETLSRLQEQHEDVIVRPVQSDHPLIESRVTYTPVAGSLAGPALVRERTKRQEGVSEAPVEGLTLQLLPHPRQVLVETARRRDHAVPIRYRDRDWHALLHVAGPDRLSGGQWEQSYAREYYRAVTSEGTLVWLYRDACRDTWYLHGWWD